VATTCTDSPLRGLFRPQLVAFSYSWRL
jgi:hypothetical protein